MIVLFLVLVILFIFVRSRGGKRFITRYKMRERMRYGVVKLSKSQRWSERPSVVGVISRPGGYVFRLRIPPGLSEYDIRSSLGYLKVILRGPRKLIHLMCECSSGLLCSD